MPQMFLNGGGMRGGSLHHLLRGARLIAETSTAPRYRLHSVGDRYPALQPAGTGGRAIAGEVDDLPLDVLRDSLLPAEPPELELGVIELADGSASLGMILRGGVLGRGGPGGRVPPGWERAAATGGPHRHHGIRRLARLPGSLSYRCSARRAGPAAAGSRPRTRRTAAVPTAG